MKKYIIEKIGKYNYTLIDEEENIYEINLEILDISYHLKDILYFNNFSNHTQYTFGPLNSKYGKNTQEDVLIIDNHKEKIYLQRYYG